MWGWLRSLAQALGLLAYEPISFGLPPRSPLWAKVRREWLLAHGSCAACGGTVSLNVHHIKPYHVSPELELDPNNLITLCEAPTRNCHLRLGHCFDWKCWNVHVVEDAALNLQRIQMRSSGYGSD